MHNVFEGEDGQHYFHVKADNGQIVAQSEGYTRAEDAERGYQALLSAVSSDVLEKHMQDLGSDACVAIGEHAFRAGWEAHRDSAFVEGRTGESKTVDTAWSDYDPPEELKGLHVVDIANEPAVTTPPQTLDEAFARVIAADAIASTDKRRGRK